MQVGVSYGAHLIMIHVIYHNVLFNSLLAIKTKEFLYLFVLRGEVFLSSPHGSTLKSPRSIKCSLLMRGEQRGQAGFTVAI